MALSTLATQVSALIDRLVILEPLSIAAITANTYATPNWIATSQTWPYWTNRPSRLIRRQRRDQYELGVIMRLNLSHISSATVGTDTVQDKAFQYIPETLAYFEAIRTTLAVGAYAEIAYLDSAGITISCPRGLDYFTNPYLGKMEALYIDFEMSVPFSLMGT